MSEWKGRQLTILLAVGAMVSFAVMGLGSAWVADLWDARQSVYESPEANCAGEHDDCSKKDLPAQVRAARASEAMVDISLAQLAVGALGLIAVGVTLVLNTRAVQHSSKQADLAEKALANADRPHLMLSTMALGRLTEELPLDETVDLSFRFGNYGRGPGWMRSYSVQSWIIPVGAAGSMLPQPDHWKTFPTAWSVAPKDWWEVAATPLKLAVLNFQKAGIIAGERDFLIFLSISYVDAERKAHDHLVTLIYEREGDRLVPIDHAANRYT